jgi:hypothetical protein
MSWLRRYDEEQRKAHEADRPRRLAVLTSEAAGGWISVIDQALPLVERETFRRPCDYQPWRAALQQLKAPDQPEEIYSPRFADADSGLINFSTDASKPGWPEAHRHLVDFALRYLEADVMFFRSGYTKRHLLRRLRQARLDQQQKARAVALIKRAVTQGTGLEEFREFCRLASKVMTDELRLWLAGQAKGVLITLDERYGRTVWEWADFFSEKELKKLEFSFPAGHRYLFEAEAPHSVVKIEDVPKDNRVKQNAWRILAHVKRTET